MSKYAELYFMYKVWLTRIGLGILGAMIVRWVVLVIAIERKDFVAKRRK